MTSQIPLITEPAAITPHLPAIRCALSSAVADAKYEALAAPYRAALEALARPSEPPGEAGPIDDPRHVPPALHGQARERTGAIPAEPPPAGKSLGQVLHEARQAGGAQRPRPWPVEDWAERDERLKVLDEAMAAAVAAQAVAAERERIRPLVAQWRAAGEHLASTNAAWSSHFYDCATELELRIGDEGDDRG